MSDRQSRARERVEDLRRSKPGAAELAMLASLAVRIEPELLRALRLQVAPHLDVGAEADLWFSSIVQARGVDGITFSAEVAEALREGLRTDARLPLVWKVIEECHAKISPALALEEKVAWLALSGSPATEIEEALAPALVALLKEERAGLAPWAARALPRLPPNARSTRAAWVLSLTASRSLAGRMILESGAPTDLLEEDFTGILSNLGETDLGIRRKDDELELGSIQGEGVSTIRVANTVPQLLEVSWLGGEQKKVICIAPGAMVRKHIGTGPVRLRTLTGAVYLLGSQRGTWDITKEARIQGIDGEVFKVVVQTVHETEVGTVWANTAVHHQVFARRIGGVRIVRAHPPGNDPKDFIELGELAGSMTWRSSLSGIPADGEKTVVYSPMGFPTPLRMAEILADHLKVLREADPGVILGPDINCSEDVMQRLADVHGMGDHVCGLLQGKGGLSIDGQGYAARGLEAALVAAARRLGWDLSKMRVVIQGFGAVGAHTGRNLRKHGAVIHAVSSVHGALVAETDEGLDIEELFADWQQFREEGRIDDAFKRFLSSPPRGARVADKNEIWSEQAEIFIPAARTDVLAVTEEVEEMRVRGYTGATDVTRFVETTGVKVVVEGANHPVTHDAESYLESKGVFILPDYLINCGGLIGCWTDWLYRRELQQAGKAGMEWYQRLNNSAPRYVSKIVAQNILRVLDMTGNKSEGMRKATYELAEKRREELARKFQGADRSQDQDGRAFGRLCMDELLE